MRTMTSAAFAYKAVLDHLKSACPSIAEQILNELRDQRSCLKLIASENYSSLTVQLAMANLLTDKYSEGSPYHRFYAGCSNVDRIEEEAVLLAQQLFGVAHAYVQPHSGADANLVALWATLIQRVQDPAVQKLGKKSIDELSAEEYESLRLTLCRQSMLGLSLASGGHLTHGYRHNVSGKMLRAVAYEVDPKSGLINYDQIAALAKKERPVLLMAGYSAYPRRLNFARLRQIAHDVGAVLLVDMAHFAGLVAGKVFVGEEDPAPFADLITTTTHKTLRGPRGGMILCTKEFAPIIDKGCPLVLGGPLPHVVAAKAIALREASSPDFRTYAMRVVDNARSLAEGLLRAGLRLLTGGTYNHLVLVDVSPLGLSGRQAELALREMGLTVNRNMIPGDQQGAWYTSGVRLGTPAVTTLGMGHAEMEEIAAILVAALRAIRPSSEGRTKYELEEREAARCRQRVKALLERYPLYEDLEIF